MPRCDYDLLAMLTFSDILAQDQVIEALTSAYKSDHLPHALIFAGKQGVGKFTTASALGAVFLCHNSKSLTPCGKCESCRVFAAGNHPDFHVVYRQLIRITKSDVKARDLAVDVIRDYLIAPANLRASLNHGKVFVVEEADLMNPAAQNVLLKTLEEPPPGTIIILLTDQPNCLLPTIRSRCQMFTFADLPQDVILSELKKRNIPAAVAKQAGRFSDGSLGLALKWIEDGVVEAAQQLTSMLDELLSGKRVATLGEFFRKSADAYGTRQLDRDEKASKDQMTKEGLSIYLKLASDHLRRQLDVEKDLDRLDQICSAIEAIVQAEKYLDANVTGALVFQQLTMHLERELI